MKIKINDCVRSSLSPNEYKYLLLLQVRPAFEKRVKKIRTELGMATLEDRITLASKTSLPDSKLLSKKVWKLVEDLNIPFSLHGSIENIVEWGEVFVTTQPFIVLDIASTINRKSLYTDGIKPKPPKDRPILLESWYSSNQEVLSSVGSIAPAYPLLQIGKKVGITQFKQSIEKNWKRIESAMDDFERSVPVLAKVEPIKTKELELNIKIFMYRQEGLSHLEIQKRIIDEEKSDFIQEPAIRQRFSDFRSFLKNLGFI